MVAQGIVRRVIRRVIHPSSGSSGDFTFSIPTVSSLVFQLLEEALNFLTGHMITAIILGAYLIKRVGFGTWRTARRSV